MRYLRILGIFVTTVVLLYISSGNKVYAHSENLGIDGADDITYDSCKPDSNGCGEDEAWYYLANSTLDRNKMNHIDDDIKTIYYKIHTESADLVWGSQIFFVKECIKAGIEKWNEVGYYKKDANGNLRCFPIAKFIDVDDVDEYHETNVDVYFEGLGTGVPANASTEAVEESLVSSDTKTFGNMKHQHFKKYKITFRPVTCTNYSTYEYITMHEIGHVFGLQDIDALEAQEGNHHNELLMGYDGAEGKVGDISYRDLAGVLVTRGIHTNSDHVWLLDNYNYHGPDYKLVCAICNCVTYKKNINPSIYQEYKRCEYVSKTADPHDLKSGNMMLVARCGKTDYWKCKYCRFTAPVSDNAIQRYILDGTYNATTHTVKNLVHGLEYTLVEEHDFTEDLGNGIYRCKLCPMCTNGDIQVPEYESLAINCTMGSLQKDITLAKYTNQIYRLDVGCTDEYNFKAIASNNLHMELFDKNFQKIEVDYLNGVPARDVSFNRILTAGTYYLRIYLVDYDYSDNVSLTINAKQAYYPKKISMYQEYDIYEHMHGTVAKYMFTAPSNTFIKVSLRVIAPNIPMFPEGTITILDDVGNIVNKLPFKDYQYLAKSCQGQNTMVLYVEKDVKYTFIIDYAKEENSEALFMIDSYESYNFDRFIDEDTNLKSNEKVNNDYIGVFTSKQIGSYKIAASFSGVNNNNKIYLFVANHRSDGDFEIIKLLEFTDTDIEYELTYDLGPGLGIYIGILGNDLEGSISMKIAVEDSYPDATFTTDTDEKSSCGTEVTINGGLYRDNHITEGFTRIAYIDALYGNATNSRLSYEWYSSNENILSVSEYGTIMAYNVDKVEVVKIIAVYKWNKKIVLKKDFIVSPDEKSDTIYIDYDLTLSESSVTQMKPDSKWPSSYIQHYTWHSDDTTIASIDMWGYIRTSKKQGTVMIYGNYNYNKRYIIRVKVTIIN